MWASTLPAVLLATLLQICTSDAKFVIHEKARDPSVNGWKLLGPADLSTQLSLSIALKQPGLQELRARLDEISNPSHQDYGAHLSRNSVRRYGEAPDAAVDAVLAWLGENDITDVQATARTAWIQFNATVGQVNALLDCNISKYQGIHGVSYRSTVYSLPEELLGLVDYVYPVTQFMANTSKKARRAADASASATKKSAAHTNLKARAGMIPNLQRPSPGPSLLKPCRKAFKQEIKREKRLIT